MMMMMMMMMMTLTMMMMIDDDDDDDDEGEEEEDIPEDEFISIFGNITVYVPKRNLIHVAFCDIEWYISIDVGNRLVPIGQQAIMLTQFKPNQWADSI